MTTKKSSSNPLRFTFRQGIKSLTTLIAVIMCGVIAFCTTLFTVANLFGERAIYDEYGTIIEYVAKKDSYHFLLFPDAEYMSQILLIAVAVCGVAAAICTFNFITSKKMVNVYYSLGITRTKLFCGKYFSGMLMLFIAVLLPMLVTYIANIVTVGFSQSLFYAVTFYFFYLFLIAASSYTITSAVFAVVGTTFETAVFSAIILFIPDIFLYSIQALMDTFLYGTPYGQQFMFVNTYNYGYNENVATLPEQFGYLSPVFWGRKQMIEFAVAEKLSAKDTVPAISPDFLTPLLWFGITVAVFFLAVLFFNRRKAEICGFIGTNRYLNSAVSLLAAFAAFCALISYIDNMVISLIAGSAVFAIVHLLLEIVVLRDMKKFARGLYKLPIGIAVSIAIVFIFNAGLFGFSQKTPELSEIKSVAVTTVGATAEYGLFSDGYGYYNSDIGYYTAPQSLVGEFTTEKDIKAVLDVHKSITETNEDDRTLKNEIQFIYTLKNGQTLKRSFCSVSPESYKKALYLEDCDFYNEALKTYFTGQIREFNEYESSPEYILSEAQKSLRTTYTVSLYSKYIDKMFTVNLSEADRIRLLESLYTDLGNRSAEEKYYPAETPVAFIYFNYGGEGVTYQEDAPAATEITERAFSAKYEDFFDSSQWMPCFNTFITSDMTNTVKVLKDMGLYEKLIAAPEFVSAEVIDAAAAYDETYGAESSDYLLKSTSRFFRSKYSSAKTTAEGETWIRYEATLDSMVQGTAVTDKTQIENLIKNAYTVYEQDSIDKGWFVSFKTADGSTSLCYIPEGKLPSGIAS